MYKQLTPIEGCLVSYSPADESKKVGVVQSTNKGMCHVKWISPAKGFDEIPSQLLISGFSVGSEVLDETPDSGHQSLGIGTVIQHRMIAGFSQVLVDFKKDNYRVWMPFQHLRVLRGTKQRLLMGDVRSYSEAEKFRLRTLAHAIESWNETTGSLSCLDIDPLPHQINLVHHILSSGNLNWLIADDVGLGKTIETGMLLHALRQRNLAGRVLLITPAGLTKQWQEEMFHKFGIEDFEIYDEDFSINTERQWKMHDYVIGSMDKLKNEKHIEKILQAENWDLVIFDEGHRLSRRQYGQKYKSSERFNLAAQLRSRTKSILILSATPHQGFQDKFIALLELLRPDRRDDLIKINIKPDIIRDMVYRNHKADVTDKDGNFIFLGKKTIATSIPVTPDFEVFDKKLSDYVKRGYSASEGKGSQALAIGFVMTIYRKLAASSSLAIYQALCNRLKKIQIRAAASISEKNEEDQMDERYFGEWEEIKFEEENASKEFFEGEQILLEGLIKHASRLIENDEKIKFLQENVIEKIFDQEDSKKILIFTEYRVTQNYLKDSLEKRFGVDSVSLINGSMSHAERDAAIKHFESSGLFLISTEAGGEGINLQRCCHVMINYDLPWNPMRLVQRIGRLYRYGQKNKVVVFNLHQPDSLDQKVIFSMYSKIDQIVLDLAKVQKNEYNEGLKEEILGDLSTMLDMESILNDLSKEGIDRTKERIESALEKAKASTIAQREIFDYAATSTPNELDKEVLVSTDHIDAFVIGMLKQMDIEYTVHREARFFRLRFPEHLVKKFRKTLKSSTILDVTVDRVVSKNRPNTHMLDMSSEIMIYMIEKAKSYNFLGMTSRVKTTESLSFDFLISSILKWQNSYGVVIKKQFCIYTNDKNKNQKINRKETLDLFLNPFEETNEILAKNIERIKPEFQIAEAAINDFMREQSTRYLLPNDLSWSTAAFFDDGDTA